MFSYSQMLYYAFTFNLAFEKSDLRGEGNNYSVIKVDMRAVITLAAGGRRERNPCEAQERVRDLSWVDSLM